MLCRCAQVSVIGSTQFAYDSPRQCFGLQLTFLYKRFPPLGKTPLGRRFITIPEIIRHFFDLFLVIQRLGTALVRSRMPGGVGERV